VIVDEQDADQAATSTTMRVESPGRGTRIVVEVAA
jgi:hypothetical protein